MARELKRLLSASHSARQCPTLKMLAEHAFRQAASGSGDRRKRQPVLEAQLKDLFVLCTGILFAGVALTRTDPLRRVVFRASKPDSYRDYERS